MCREAETLLCQKKVRIAKAMVFRVVIYDCESWTIKKTECQRIDAFELVLEKTPESPWTARRWNQSILREINPKYSLEGLILKLKLQYFGHLMQTADLLEKTLMLGKIEGRRRGHQRMKCLDGITNAINLGKLWEMVRPGMLHAWGHKESDILGDWTTEQ